MRRRAGLFLSNEPDNPYPLEEGSVLIGRSEKCDLRLADPFVSRQQARITSEGGSFTLENVGGNPILVNGSRVDRCILNTNDVITLGKTELVFRAETEGPAASEEIAGDAEEADGTVMMARQQPVEHGPRLLVAEPNGQMRSYPIHQDVTVIGRSPEADLRLDGLSVSRKHCIIEKRDGMFVARNLSNTGSLIVNGVLLEEKPLVSGDQIQVGAFTVSFVSDRPEDIRPAAVMEPAGRRGSSVAAWTLVSLLLLSIGGYLVYSRIYTGWKIRQTIKNLAEQVESGNHEPTREPLSKLLAARLPEQDSAKVKELLSRATILQAQELAETGRLKEAKDFLASTVNEYGVGEDTKAVRDLLDAYRLRTGRQLDSSGQQLAALQEFAAVSEDSPHFGEAQQAISRIWLSSQQKILTERPLAQLLKDAEESFSAKKYTTPLNDNAYAIYKTILGIDPNNETARRRIEQMKDFYRESGDRYLGKKSYAVALSYYERYMLIDPDALEVKDKVAACRKHSAGRRSARQRPEGGKSEDSGRRQRMKSLIESPAAEHRPD